MEWFTPSEIGKTKYVNNSVRKLSDIGLDNSSAKLLPIGTVLLTTRATLGEMSIAKRECSTNQGFQSLIPHTDRVSSEYLYYMQIIIKPWCEKYASGNTFREISKSALSDCIIPIPDRARQEQIVKLLSSIDMLIGAAESISMSLSKIRHGLMQQLFIWKVAVRKMFLPFLNNPVGFVLAWFCRQFLKKQLQFSSELHTKGF